MRFVRTLVLAMMFMGAVASTSAFAAPLLTFNVAGTFGTPEAGFPLPDIASFTGQFTVDAGMPDTSFSGFTVFPIQASFSFYNASSVVIHTAAYSYPDALVRVANGFFVVFLGPPLGAAPDDFRLQFSGPFVNTGLFPSAATLAAAAFNFGFTETDTAGVFVSSATLTAVPEPMTAGLVAIGMLGVAARRRLSRRDR